GVRAVVALLCDRHLGHDALGRHALEKLLAACEPGHVSTQPRHDPQSTLGDLAPQLRPERSRAGCSNDVAGGPGVACRVVGIRGQRLPFTRQTRELTSFTELTDPSLDPSLDTGEPRLVLVVAQARRSTTAPDAVTATAVGTST